MILASILIGPSSSGEETILPPLVAENMRSLTARHPDLPHKLFMHDEIVGLIEEHYPREVLDAFNTLRPFAYKADLARYCILHTLGGIYADLSYFLVGPLPFSGSKPVVFRDFLFSAPWDTCVGLIAVPRGHKALARAIEQVCANVKNRYYGPTPLCPTGPALFGKALAATCEPEELVCGQAVAVQEEHLRELVPGVELPAGSAIHCLSLAGQLLAIKRKPLFSKGLSDLGLSGSDIYQERWDSRAIYVD